MNSQPTLSQRLWCLFARHIWKILGSGPIHNQAGRTVGKYYIMQCVHCGKIKEKEYS